MDDGSVLAGEWIAEMAVRWAARRAEASAGGGGGAWLDSRAAQAVACDAAVTPVVTGDVDPGILDDLVRLHMADGTARQVFGFALNDGYSGLVSISPPRSCWG